MSVNRTELVAKIAERANISKVHADAALAAFQDVLVESLSKGETVKVTGLLSVERVERAARTGRNPRTGEEIKIPAGFGVKLSAGSLFLLPHSALIPAKPSLMRSRKRRPEALNASIATFMMWRRGRRSWLKTP